MTSSLLRKRRTTLQSIARPTWAEASACLALVLIFGGSFRPAGADDSLQSLKSRSADQRWGRSAPPKSTKPQSEFDDASSSDPTPPPGREPAARVALEDLDTPPRPVGDPFSGTSRISGSTGSSSLKKATAAKRPARVQRVSQAADESAPKVDDLPKLAPKDDRKDEEIPTETAPVPEPDRPPFQHVEKPSQLKKVSVILPYADYEPDPEIAAKDPCRNQCPRPGECKGEPQLCPEELWASDDYVPRLFPDSSFTWAASNIWYNPLYFQDVALERYGHTWCEPVQPFVSVAKFGTQLVFLPYQMAIDPPCKKEYALGYYRPGDCAPKLCYQPPLSARGAIAQAGVVTGLFFLIP